MAATDQAEVIAFLSAPDSYPARPRRVERRDTHGAIVFMAGDEVFKIKRQVAFSYMDFSTVALRRRAVEREIEVNQPHAPDLYLGAVAIVRRDDGTLAFGGPGTTVEWAVHMRRFDQQDLLSAVADRGALTPVLAKALADAVFESHATAPVCSGIDGAAAMASILTDLDRNLASVDLGHSTFRHEEFKVLSQRRLARASDALRRRAATGRVRRCHGDLHLDNLVLWQGRPTLFDAIEFNENFATIDTLYDLCFLLMDLDHRGHRTSANIVFNRYFWRLSAGGEGCEGIVALPLFLALRSAIRGMVVAQRARQQTALAGAGDLARARASLDEALHYLSPKPPRLVAVGGLSGSGKSTLAAALAPRIGAAPGALHLRTDLERKALMGVGETDRLPDEAYTAPMSARVYAHVLERAAAALDAGHAVIVDAVFAKPAERAEIENVAARRNIPFTGLWLDAPTDTMKARVTARRDDASDATAAIVERQLAYDIGAMTWARIDAGGGAEATCGSALKLLPD